MLRRRSGPLFEALTVPVSEPHSSVRVLRTEEELSAAVARASEFDSRILETLHGRSHHYRSRLPRDFDEAAVTGSPYETREGGMS